jgi:predicted secreted protein
MSNAILATGTIITMADAGGSVYTTIAELRSISGPALTRNVNDVTTHNSVGGWEEALPGMARSGEISFDINYVPTEATHNDTTGLVFVFRTKARRNFRIIFSNVGLTVWSWAGYVVGFEIGAEVDNALTASVTLKPDGTMTLA